jgi:acyl dehydratase
MNATREEQSATHERMSTTRELSTPPATLGLLLRAALPLVPGASTLPFIAGGGSEIPDTTIRLAPAQLSADRLAAYARVCGFTSRKELLAGSASREKLPASAPHLLAFPLHMALMTEGSFPFGAVGLVHVSNQIVLHRPIGVREALAVCVHATPLQPHPRGKTFTIVSEAKVGEELVWEERSTMLRRGGGKTDSGKSNADARAGGSETSAVDPSAGETSTPTATAQWDLPEDLGRRYAAVSGDRNPIHMHAVSARLFGFPRAIAHGMWTMARCLAELEASLPEAYAVEVDFRKPILLPGRVAFAATQTQMHTQTRMQTQAQMQTKTQTQTQMQTKTQTQTQTQKQTGSTTSFAVSAAQDETTIHLEGTVTR